MTKFDDLHKQKVIRYLIDDSVVGNTDAITISSRKLPVPDRPWIFGQIQNGLFDIRVIRIWNLGKFLLRPSINPNPVGHF